MQIMLQLNVSKKPEGGQINIRSSQDEIIILKRTDIISYLLSIE